MPRSETPRPPLLLAAPTASATRPRPAAAAGLVSAQLEAKRGLRAGTGTLTQARRAYLGTQWSGEDDRRPEPGLLTRARI